MKRLHDRWPWNSEEEPRGSAREEMQRIAFTLMDRKAHKWPRGMVFTSPGSGAGTSTVTIGVAREIQRNPGVRCVVVEMNRLRPCFAKRLGRLDEDRSVKALALREEILPKCAQKEPHGLLVVPAGGQWPAAEAAKIACQAMQDAEPEFDIVLFDAPAFGESVDAMAIGSAVKEMIVVAAAGRTSTESLERLRTQAAANGVKVAGSVLTMRDRVAPRWLFGGGRR